MPRPSRKIAIMQAAARLFAAKGYNAVSVRDIAAEMELTPASLYYYFPDKETLYRQTLVMVFTGVQSAFKAPQGTTGIEKMECLIRNVVTYCCGNPIFTRLLLRELNEGWKSVSTSSLTAFLPPSTRTSSRYLPSTGSGIRNGSWNPSKVPSSATCSSAGYRTASGIMPAIP